MEGGLRRGGLHLSWLALATGIALMLEETSVLIHSYWAHPLPAETKMTVQPEAAV